MKTTFIYALCEPGTRIIRYIGKSDNPSRRLTGHCCGSSKHQSHLGDWLRKVKSQGIRPTLIVLQEVASSEWKTAEEKYIRAARMLGMDLVNGTDGGDGGEAFNQGPSHPQFGLVGPLSHNFGRKHSDETRRNMSLAHKRNTPVPEVRVKKSGAGIPRSEETRVKISKSLLGHRVSEVSRIKMSQSHKGIPWTDARRSAQKGAKI